MTSTSLRRHKATGLVVLLAGLVATGVGYAAVTSTAEAAPTTASAAVIDQGKQLYLEGCSSCHGLAAQGTSQGPGLIGVGAAAVDFQVSTGRMPLAGPNVQAPRIEQVKFTETQIAQMAAYVASLAPGPGIPDKKYTEGEDGDVAMGGELFRVNCAMCHNFAGSGGALTRGKYAPSLYGVEGKNIYEAMLTGPQSMPVFNDANMSPESKNDIIAYLKTVESQQNVGGMNLGNMGPVSEGMFAWIFALALMIACAFWLGQKAA